VTIPSFVFFLIYVATALTCIGVLLQLTRLAHSSFRNQLWILRDHITDDLRRGKLRPSPSALRLRELVEIQIRDAGRHTILDSIVATMIFMTPGKTSIYDDILAEDVPAQDYAAVKDYLSRLRDANINYLNWGSLSGWLLFPLFRLASRLGRWYVKRQAQVGLQPARTTELKRKVERAELEVMPEVMPSRGSRSHERSMLGAVR